MAEHSPHFDEARQGPTAPQGPSENNASTIKSEDAEDILGLRIEAPITRTPQEEFEAYRQEALEATDLLRYWEVSGHNVADTILNL